jgi:peptide subunit release factor 1 (eRF1)
VNELSFIKALQNIRTAEGPFLSLYLNTETRDENGVEQLQLRWRNLRGTIEDKTSPEVLGKIDSIVSGSHQQGDGLVVIASGDDVLLRRYLRRPIDDSIEHGPLPRLWPLFEWGQENPAHIVLLADRVGAEIYIVHPDRDVEQETVEGDKPDIGRTRRGGWAQPRYQRGATKAWRDNATKVGEELGTISEREDIDIIIVAGDVQAIHYLKENMPLHGEFIFEEIDGSRQLQLDDIEEELDKALASYSGQSIDKLLEKFVEERGQQDLAVEGLEPTLEALRMAQVDTLLIRTGGIEGTAHASAENPSQAAASGGPLAELGLEDVVQGEAADVAVAGAIASGAKVVVIPELSEKHGPAEGIGALLRYTT